MTEPDGRLSPRVVVLFGATGDLAQRMLFPALLDLYRRQLMPSEFRVVGSGRHSPGSDEEFREQVREALADAAGDGGSELDEFLAKLSFTTSDADDGSDLAAAVNAAEEEIGAEGDRLLYLSVPPEAMEAMAGMLAESGLAEGASLVIEKPFGNDLASARDLNRALHEVFGEAAIYRIDHFLGKEAVQNLLALRFFNDLLEPLWNRERIAYVQIDIPEEIDIEGRGSFYEETGAFRDMVVNHLLQTLGVVAMEPPPRLDAAGLHAERSRVLAAVRPLDPAAVVFGQYEGYRDEEDVEDDSRTETFAALRVELDNERWRGVPFYLRTGKALAEDRRLVTVGLATAPGSAPPEREEEAPPARPNELVFDLSEEATVEIDLRVKAPGPGFSLAAAPARLDVVAALADEHGLEAYARLLLGAMREDRGFFSSAEQVERLWEICQPVLDDPPTPRPYALGSWGPEEAIDLAAAPGWRLPEGDS
jgi:glucose-6-phosphate 1-dehydrogenase